MATDTARTRSLPRKRAKAPAQGRRTRLKVLTPFEGYTLARIAEKRHGEEALVQRLDDPELRALAEEVLKVRDTSDLSRASRGARSIVRWLRAE